MRHPVERLEGKISECLFFYAKILYNNSVISFQKEKKTAWPDLYLKRNDNKNWYLVFSHWFLVTNENDIIRKYPFCTWQFGNIGVLSVNLESKL